MKEFIVRWFHNLPLAERDMPAIPYKGKVYTPRQVYEMAINGTLPDDLQEKIERGDFTTAMEVYRLGVERVLSYLKSIPPEFVISVGGKPYTVKELIEEVEKGTAVGRAFVEAEIRKWEMLYRRKSHVGNNQPGQ